MRLQNTIIILFVSFIALPSTLQAQEGCNAPGCHDKLFKKTVLHDPFTDDCESCHEANGNEHPETAGNEFSLTAESPDLCYECHDAQNTMENIHPPVDDGECLSCHSPHSSDEQGLLLETENGNICLECHDLELSEFVHHPVKDNKCTSCHNPHQSPNASLLEKQSPDLCLSCHHDQKKEMDEETVHAAFEEDCLNCHQPHSSVESKLLIKGVPDLCNECHELDMSADNLHPPAEDGECLSCHRPHSSQQPDLFVSNACTECHELEKTGKYAHQPVEEGNCAGCHEPHASANSLFLKAEGPQLCFSCHNKEKQNTSLPNIHPPFEEDCTACHQPHYSDNKQLLKNSGSELCMECHEAETVVDSTRTVHGALRKELPCKSCHTAHASDKEALLRAKQPELCLTCHKEEITFHDRQIVNIGNILQTAESVHPPVEDDDCTACHQLHSETYPFLLTDAFPKSNYARINSEESYALCFNCHDSEIILKKETTSATEFRNGKLNLHFLHVNREKSRSCSNCHDAHGAAQESLIAEKVHFGNWFMPVHYKKTDNGGSCLTGCHEEKFYKR